MSSQRENAVSLIRDLRRQIAEHEARIAEIGQTIKSLEDLYGLRSAKTTPATKLKSTIPDLVTESLRGGPLSTEDLVNRVADLGGSGNPNTIAVTLSRLKKSNKVERAGKLWMLAKREQQ